MNFGTLMLSNSVEAPSEAFLEILTISGRNAELSTELPTLNGTEKTVESLEKTTEEPGGMNLGVSDGDNVLIEEEQAATIIQARFCGYQAHKVLKASVLQLDTGF